MLFNHELEYFMHIPAQSLHFIFQQKAGIYGNFHQLRLIKFLNSLCELAANFAHNILASGIKCNTSRPGCDEHPSQCCPAVGYKQHYMDIILKYLSGLSQQQIEQFTLLDSLYKDWNSKVNLISRKDIDNLYTHHVLHSLAIAKVVRFLPNAEILDLGTGGGFPGIPLSILFPDTMFHLIDGALKKVKVVQHIQQNLKLDNVQVQQVRVEELKGRKYDFVVTRAVADLSQLFIWSSRLIKGTQQHALPNGLLALKGGDVNKEILALPKGEYSEIFSVQDFFEESYFLEKYVVYVQC
jgi:16S rRNA (guanine527-N7)-methyltransferase